MPRRARRGAFSCGVAMRLLERLIGRLKGDPAYRWSSSYSFRQILTIVSSRSAQAVRGLWLRLWLHDCGSPLFCGSRVTIAHGSLVRFGASVIVEDDVYINALSTGGVTLGNNVTIARASVLVCTGVIARRGEGIRIGDRSAVGAQSFLGGQGGITIGDDVIMGPGVRIFSENHIFASPEIPIRLQGESRAPVAIANDCWIGAGAIILAGVRIETGTVIAAGAVVTKSHPARSVLGGVPATVIGTR